MVQTTVAPTARPKPGRVFSRPVVMPKRNEGAQNPTVAILGNGGTLSKLFPRYEERTQQLDLSAFVWDCFTDRKHGAGEAGTGVGKSLAYLVPLILTGRPGLVAVPTNALLTQLLTKDLPTLAQPGVMPRRFTFAELKGRANYLCRFKADRFAEAPDFQSSEDVKAWPLVQDWIKETRDGDLAKIVFPLPMALRSEITATSDECLGEMCPAYDACYAETAKAIAKEADIIVTNLTMLMLDLEIRAESGGMASIIPDREFVVIDEGHQTRERAASAATTEITLGSFERIASRVESLARTAEKVARAEAEAPERLAAIIAEANERGEMPRIPEAPQIVRTWTERLDDPRRLLRDLFDRFAARLLDSKRSAETIGNELDVSQDALVSLHGLVGRMFEECPSQLEASDRKTWEKTVERMSAYFGGLCNCLFPSPLQPMANRNTVRFATIDDKQRVTFSHAPIDVAPWLRDRLWTASLVRPAEKTDGTFDRSVCVPVTVVTVSATIVDDSGSLGYFRETVGLDQCREIVVGSPFNYRDHGVLYVPADAGFDPSAARGKSEDWAGYLDRLTDEYERLIRIAGGRAFCLFTANSTLDIVYSRLRSRGLPYPMLRQGELPQPELIRRFKEAGNAVLFGVKSYWEGVDVQGEALSIVIISGTPFTPPDDPIYAARCRMVDQRYGGRASFQKISIPEAVIALKQAAGRGIRSTTDTAAICILDSRLRYKKYGPGVVAAMPPMPFVDSTEAVAEFFERIS